MQRFLVPALCILAFSCSFGNGGSHSGINKYLKTPEKIQILGTSGARQTKLCNVLGIFFWDAHYGMMLEEVVNEAASKKGGNLLINYTAENKVTTYFLFSTCTTSVVGVAARADMGIIQDLTEEELEMSRKYKEREKKIEKSKENDSKEDRDKNEPVLE